MNKNKHNYHISNRFQSLKAHRKGLVQPVQILPLKVHVNATMDLSEMGKTASQTLVKTATKTLFAILEMAFKPRLYYENILNSNS